MPRFVPDEEVRTRFMNLILGEHRRTRLILEDLFQGPFDVRRPRLAYTLNIREEPLLVLHRQQVALLREWRRKLQEGQAEAADNMLSDLMVSVNALASGLRTTG
jgi:phosphoenolpyruvate carboxylase